LFKLKKKNSKVAGDFYKVVKNRLMASIYGIFIKLLKKYFCHFLLLFFSTPSLDIFLKILFLFLFSFFS